MLTATPITYVPSATVQRNNAAVTCPEHACPPACENVFDLVHVSYLIRGGTRVLWTLLDTFNDPPPWTFQLQVGRTGSQLSDDWVNVGIAMENTCYAVDPEQQNFTKGETDTHYRVKLTTPVGTYYSEPVAKLGILSRHDWRLAQEIVRKEKLRFRLAAQDGYLLKRRVTGTNCSRCLDLQTMEVTDPYCPQCWGTGKECGYYYPIACVWADLSPVTHRKHVDDQAVRGTIQDIVVTARMLMLPLIEENDVWISRKTDERFYLQTIQNVTERRGVPLVANVQLRPAPYTDVIYRIAIPQQDAWLQGLG